MNGTGNCDYTNVILQRSFNLSYLSEKSSQVWDDASHLIRNLELHPTKQYIIYLFFKNNCLSNISIEIASDKQDESKHLMVAASSSEQ